MWKKYLFTFLFLFSVQHLIAQNFLPYILDMVHNNPGEEPYVTKYNNPDFLKSQGFTGAVTHWHINCAITYDNYRKNLLRQGEEREWIEARAADIDRKLVSFHRVGIAVYPFTDFIVFPRSVWKEYGGEITGQVAVVGTGGLDERARKSDLQSKRTQELLVAQIDGIFSRFPQLDGLTLCFGETYLHDKVLAEKCEAVAIWLQIEALSQQFCSVDIDLQEAVRGHVPMDTSSTS